MIVTVIDSVRNSHYLKRTSGFIEEYSQIIGSDYLTMDPVSISGNEYVITHAVGPFERSAVSVIDSSGNGLISGNVIISGYDPDIRQETGIGLDDVIAIGGRLAYIYDDDFEDPRSVIVVDGSNE